jgi:hypothetical protein
MAVEFVFLIDAEKAEELESSKRLEASMFFKRMRSQAINVGTKV